MKKITLILFFLIYAVTVNAQTILDRYIREGLQDNEGIKQQSFMLQSNVHALRAACALFFPTVTVSGSYSKAAGGRTIDFPLGDLLNPIYSSLNDLTASQQFPTVENQRFVLAPDNFYDARVRIGLTLFDAELIYNRMFKSNAVSLKETEINLYKRELIKEIKIAYYQYCMATGNVEVASNNLALTQENHRINNTLYTNDKLNYSTLLRSGSEVSGAEASLYSAVKGCENRRAYFNFLLNKPFDREIEREQIAPEPFSAFNEPLSLAEQEEITQLNLLSVGQKYMQQLTRSFVLPKVRTFLDLGSQGYDWNFNEKTRYYVFGVSLEWTFSTGGRDIHKMRQASSEMDALESQTIQVKRQLDLQRITSYHDYEDAVNRYHDLKTQLNSIQRYYRDMEKRYKEENALYIELIEAKTLYFNTLTGLNIALYQACIKYAEYERVVSGYNLTSKLP